MPPRKFLHAACGLLYATARLHTADFLALVQTYAKPRLYSIESTSALWMTGNDVCDRVDDMRKHEVHGE